MSRRPMTSKRSLLLAAMLTAAVSMAGCSTLSRVNPFHKKGANKTLATQGQRISVIAFDQKVEPAEALKGADFFLPEPAVQADWPLPGGNAEQSVEHVAAGANFDIAWRKGFGQKANRKYHVTAPPVAADGKVFVMDGEATVVAMDTRSGSTIWRKDLRPAKAPGKKHGFL
ncbi:MAG: dehydrogenase, partial [Caulobacter sp.]|nr:dehydrogenase [Caulobacter sp.]